MRPTRNDPELLAASLFCLLLACIVAAGFLLGGI